MRQRRINQFCKLKALLEKPVFSSKDARELNIGPSLLCYYAKEGFLEKLGRGLYRKANATLDVDFKWEDLVLASKSITKGVICLTSALALYDLTDEIPRKHWIAVPHEMNSPKRDGVKIVRMRNMSLGKTKMVMGEVKLAIFNRERTIIDAFRYLSIETALKALKIGLEKSGDEKLNLLKLQSYAKKLRVNLTPYLMAITT